MTLPFIRDLSRPNLSETIIGLGEPGYRGKQVCKWLYQKRVGSFDGMENLPKTFRTKMASAFEIRKLDVRKMIESANGDAVKFAYECSDGAIIESVLLLDGRRRTACLSSQLGCALGCVFCRTGSMGFIRNLTQSEILGQLIGINDYLWNREERLVTNVVFMGMGEALSNYEVFRSCVDIIEHPDGFNLGNRKVTVSTAGVVPSIERLTKDEVSVSLAISLNTYSNQRRDKLMPINRRYPLEQLVAAARQFAYVSGRPITFEYVVIAGENDSAEAARALSNLLRSCPNKINLIPLNPGGKVELKGPTIQTVEQFGDRLRQLGLTVTIRSSRGQDIDGACGQLAGSFAPRSDPA